MVNRQPTDRLQMLFDSLLEQPSNRWVGLLDAHCGQDLILRRELESLLRASENVGDFLATPEAHLGPVLGENRDSVEVSKHLTSGTRIDRYQVLKLLDEGGFGAVYLAEQLYPIRRQVALKVIKLGMDTKQVIARFEAERQALAMMDHPHIAKVHDAGAMPTGRPYFVMEFVAGQPITLYSDQQQLTVDERLALFVQVCLAVQHAHQKGIIHRDLKPTNVLVATHNEKAVPKVIDFGIAKAVNQRLTERTLVTECRQLLGTPEYMSPEQTEMGFDIDTRSDVYSLGALLYELLTGTTPFSIRELRDKPWEEVLGLIRQLDPPHPSARLISLDRATLGDVATRRRSEPGKLVQRLAGELDSIVMKCLDKDRTRRYETASELAIDVQRYLNGEPVQARPSTVFYRVAKFARRNKVTVAAVSAVTVALLLGLAGTSIGMARARQAQARAEKEAQSAATAIHFMREMLGIPTAEAYGLGRFTRIADLLDREVVQFSQTGESKLDRQLDHFYRLGRSFLAIGMYDQAAGNLRHAAELAQQLRGEADELTLGIMSRQVQALRELKSREAETVARDAYDAARRRFGRTHPQSLLAAGNLADTLYFYDTVEAERLYRQLLQHSRQDTSATPAQLMALMTNLSFMLYCNGKLDEAESLSREAVTRTWSNGAGEVVAEIRAEAVFIRAQILDTLGRDREASALYQQTLSHEQSRHRLTHPFDQWILGWYSEVLARTGDLPAARRLREEILQITTTRHAGRDTWEVADAYGKLASLLDRYGDIKSAQQYWSKAINARRHAMGDGDRQVQFFMRKKVAICRALGQVSSWENPWLHQHLSCALDEFLLDQRAQALSLEDADWDRLHLQLDATNHSGGDFTYTTIAAGKLQELKTVGALEPGNYRLTLKLSWPDGEPLYGPYWLLFTDWDVAQYGWPHSIGQADVWREISNRPPITQRVLPSLGLSSGSMQANLCQGWTQSFMLTAKSKLSLPPGTYCIRSRSDDGIRVSLDGRPIIDAWRGRIATTDEALVQLDGEEHDLRVDYFQDEGDLMLWVRVEPVDREGSQVARFPMDAKKQP